MAAKEPKDMRNDLFSMLTASSSLSEFFLGVIFLMIFRVAMVFFSALFVAYGLFLFLPLFHVHMSYLTMAWAIMMLEVGIDLYTATLHTLSKTEDSTKDNTEGTEYRTEGTGCRTERTE